MHEFKFYITGLIICFFLVGCNIQTEIEGGEGGSVRSEDGLISCPETNCSYNYDSGISKVRLIAEPKPGYVFSGFLNADKLCINGEEDSLATATCELSTSTPKTLIAIFTSIVGEMILIPKGNFLMGSDYATPAERPVHVVSIEPFYVGETEVTWSQYQRCVEAAECAEIIDDGGFGKGDRPIINISWNGAQAYIDWLNEVTGETFRLPTESEWEYLARAGTLTNYSFGDCVSAENANISGFTDELLCGEPFNLDETLPVKSYEPNLFGVYDVHGNVAEMVQDCYNGSYEDAPDNGDAWMDGDCSVHIVRGGGYRSRPFYATSFFRSFVMKRDQKSNFVGFRLVKEALNFD